MKNCGGCSNSLRKLILNIPNHYLSNIVQYGSCHMYCLQGIHSDCHPSSSCHDPGYIFSRVQLTNPQACQALLSGLKDTYVYRYAEDFCQVCMLVTVSPLAIFSKNVPCRDTYWIENFNHQLLTYLPKRIHFSTRVFNVRTNLAVMDWVRHNFVNSSCLYMYVVVNCTERECESCSYQCA